MNLLYIINHLHYNGLSMMNNDSKNSNCKYLKCLKWPILKSTFETVFII